MLIQDYTEFNDKRFEVTWKSGRPVPVRDQITQASAICFTPDNQIVMVSGNGLEWHIPGGHPEEGESLHQALGREVWEEACCEVIEPSLLGWQHVRDLQDDSVHIQMRYWCRVQVQPFDPQHEMRYRKFVGREKFLQTLAYGHSPLAKEMFRLAIEANQSL